MNGCLARPTSPSDFQTGYSGPILVSTRPCPGYSRLHRPQASGSALPRLNLAVPTSPTIAGYWHANMLSRSPRDHRHNSFKTGSIPSSGEIMWERGRLKNCAMSCGAGGTNGNAPEGRERWKNGSSGSTRKTIGNSTKLGAKDGQRPVASMKSSNSPLSGRPLKLSGLTNIKCCCRKDARPSLSVSGCGRTTPGIGNASEAGARHPQRSRPPYWEEPDHVPVSVPTSEHAARLSQTN